MTSVFLTIDTEYSPGMYRTLGKAGRTENFLSSIIGRTPHGETGIRYQMDMLDRHGLKAVFFVDPMASLVWGVSAITDVVGPIVARGCEVQLHLHTEWLEFARANNVLPTRTGRDIKDFRFEEQCKLIEYARATLVAAGAPAPAAFRAGNYGANDDTLRALATLGLRYDSSFCPGISGSACAISIEAHTFDPTEVLGVIEVPVGCIGAPRHGLRHLQLTAVTESEIVAAIRDAARNGRTSMTLVSHSFELLSRDRARINLVVKRRFEKLCRELEAMPDTITATYATSPPSVSVREGVVPLPHQPLRTARRYAEQALSNALYGRW